MCTRLCLVSQPVHHGMMHTDFKIIVYGSINKMTRIHLNLTSHWLRFAVSRHHKLSEPKLKRKFRSRHKHHCILSYHILHHIAVITRGKARFVTVTKLCRPAPVQYTRWAKTDTLFSTSIINLYKLQNTTYLYLLNNFNSCYLLFTIYFI